MSVPRRRKRIVCLAGVLSYDVLTERRCQPFTIHYSLFTIHYSLFTPHELPIHNDLNQFQFVFQP
jgi:hypothetical protein